MGINTSKPIYFGYTTSYCNENNICHRSGISNDLDRLLRYCLGGTRHSTEYLREVTISDLFNPNNDLFTIELETIRS